ncbi:putative NADH kinase [Nymphaea thermarum]|nr:putative NADH kinase [Nymphaea thermarum]
MSRSKVLLLTKPFDVYRSRLQANSLSSISPSPVQQVLSNLENRKQVHNKTIKLCESVLQHKSLEWETIMRNELSGPIHHFDLVVTVGGDGTLLRASHYMDGSIPVLGVNSDPTQPEEVEEKNEEFDATRSTGYLCAATAESFEQVLTDIVDNTRKPSELSRIAVTVNNRPLPTHALNDILIAHPCPAAVSRFSFRIRDSETYSTLVNSRSSGLRVCTAAGSTAAMLSAGGFPMPISSKDLQYMVREPILPGASAHLMHGSVKSNNSMHIFWNCKGHIYIDGCHAFHPVVQGDAIEVSAKAPILKVFLPSHILCT